MPSRPANTNQIILPTQCTIRSLASVLYKKSWKILWKQKISSEIKKGDPLYNFCGRIISLVTQPLSFSEQFWWRIDSGNRISYKILAEIWNSNPGTYRKKLQILTYTEINAPGSPWAGNKSKIVSTKIDAVLYKNWSILPDEKDSAL